VETPTSETLLWAYFVWLVLKEAPEAAWAYVVFFDRLRDRRRRPRHHVLELHDSVTATDRIEPAVLNLAPAIGRATTRLELTTGGAS
jgi:hypothetical protein